MFSQEHIAAMHSFVEHGGTSSYVRTQLRFAWSCAQLVDALRDANPDCAALSDPLSDDFAALFDNETDAPTALLRSLVIPQFIRERALSDHDDTDSHLLILRALATRKAARSDARQWVNGARVSEAVESTAVRRCAVAHGMLAAQWLDANYADSVTACSDCGSMHYSLAGGDERAHDIGDPLSLRRVEPPHAIPTVICRHCDNNYINLITGERIRLAPAHHVRAQDTGRYARNGYARNHWHMDTRGHLYETETARDHAEEDYRAEMDSDDYGGDSVVLDYNANPFDYFKWHKANAHDALVMGVELEMESVDQNEDQVREIIDALGGNVCDNAILKHDGSLDYGVELCTMPFTLDQHRKEFNWQRLTAVHRLAMSGTGTNNCGMHVHVNRSALTALQLGKMLVFMNSPELRTLITAVAQRQENSYCKRKTKKLSDGKYFSDDRYDILNVGVRRPTAEFRLFKGNLRPERVLKNLEFVHAVCVYCRDVSMRDVESWANFSRWLIAKRGQYPQLVRFLAERGVFGFRQLQDKVLRRQGEPLAVLTDA